MNLCIDIGNTRTKAAIYDGWKMEQYFPDIKLEDLKKMDTEGISSCFISKTGSQDALEGALSQHFEVHYLNYRSDLPISLDYQTPETLGADRIATAVAAHHFYPEMNVAILDAGTCITLDFLDREGIFRGGSISPGLHMRLKAMHTFTAALPSLELNPNHSFPGKSTESSMQVGVYQAVQHEIRGFLASLERQFSDLLVVDCSNHPLDFEMDFNYQIFAHPKFVLEGLNVLAQQHA